MSVSSSAVWLNNLLRDPKPLDIIICVAVLYFLGFQVYRFIWPASTKLLGPPSESWIFGVSKKVFEAKDSALLFEEWAEQYGSVFRIPEALGSSRIILCDPKAIAYFYTTGATSFKRRTLSKLVIERLFGQGLLSAEGDSHKRQRKALTPAFSTQAIRALTVVFFDSAFKVKAAWDDILDASISGSVLLNVQEWMNKVSLDSIGIAGFAHDFGTLRGQESKITQIFDSFTQVDPKASSFGFALLSILTPVLPLLEKIPTGRSRTVAELNDAIGQISHDLLERTRAEKMNHPLEAKGPKSLIETLVLAKDAPRDMLTESEVLAQMKTLLLAGYETTSIILTWALINLCLHPDTQDALRTELAESNTDPTFEQLSGSLPYLDAVIKETLRLHPADPETFKVATNDLVLPLNAPLTSLGGKLVDSIHVAKGTSVSVSIRLVNRSKAIWGEDAKEFKPSRWLYSESGISDKAKEIHGWAHILTFIDGPKACLGRQFAIMELKIVLSTLIRHYEFKLPNGVDTKFDEILGVLPRPRAVGEKGGNVPMLVKRIV